MEKNEASENETLQLMLKRTLLLRATHSTVTVQAAGTAF